jgi:hypothetical protein
MHAAAGSYFSMLAAAIYCELPDELSQESGLLAEELKQTPSEWMPWNYHATLARTGALLDAA